MVYFLEKCMDYMNFMSLIASNLLHTTCVNIYRHLNGIFSHPDYKFLRKPDTQSKVTRFGYLYSMFLITHDRLSTHEKRS